MRMRRAPFFLTLAVAAAGLLAAGRAQAQIRPFGGPVTPSPVVSPYLNLLRPGVPPYISYYGIVRPELATRSSLQNLQQEIGLNQQAITTLDAAAAAPVVTGHPSYYLNTSRYFLTRGQGPTTGLAGLTRPATTAAATTPAGARSPYSTPRPGTGLGGR